MVQRETQQEEWSWHPQAGLCECPSSPAVDTKHTDTRLSYHLVVGRGIKSNFLFTLGTKTVLKKKFFQMGRKGEVERKGHPVPLHVVIQDKATGAAHWSTTALKGLWWTPDHLQHPVLGSCAPTLHHHMPWVPVAQVLLVEPHLGIGSFPLRSWKAIRVFAIYRNLNEKESR